MSNARPFQGRLGFDANNSKIINVSAPTALSDAVNYGAMTVPTHNPTRTYPIGFVVEYNGSIYKSKTSLVAKDFNVNDWDVISAGAFVQSGDSVSRLMSDKLLETSISILDYKKPDDGNDIRPALLKAVAAIKSGNTKSRVLLIPPTPSYWEVSSQVLFDISDFTLLIYGNVKLTSNVRQKTFLFAYDTGMAPTTPLRNVTVLGNGSYVDGNASAMTFNYTHGDGSDNDSTIRFNYVDNINVVNVWVDNGPIDCLSTRQCRGRIADCRFSRSKEDNGFSATTDWDPANWAYGKLDTYGLTIVENCWAHDCRDLGMTAFNCSAVFFVNCRSWRCDGGFSYEDSYGAPDIKLYDGGFFGCWAFDCLSSGFYITADCAGLDAFCRSWNIRGYPGDNTNGLYEHGVLVSDVKRISIGGSHGKCGGCGIAVFNQTGYPMEVTIDADLRDNDWHGIRGRGVGILLIKSGTKVKGNGKVLVRGSYGNGIEVSNTGGANYLQGKGVVKVGDCFIDDNGGSAININYVGLVDIQSNICRDNAVSIATTAINVTNATTAKILDNHCPSITGKQTFSVNITQSVLDGYEGGNSGSGTGGIISNAATRIRQSDRGEMYATVVYTPGAIANGSQVATTVPVIGTTVGDFVIANFSSDPTLSVNLAGVVSTDGNVTVYFRNSSGSTITLASGTLRVLVTKRNGG